MRIAFFCSEKTRERDLARAFAVGARRYGHKVEFLRNNEQGLRKVKCDLACMVGVKSKRIWDDLQARGIRTMMFDKGYCRDKGAGSWLYWRIAFDNHQPTAWTMDREYSADRFVSLGLPVVPWREDGNHILIAGSSEKYHNFHNLPHPTEYARALVGTIREHTDRPILYRPKPSWGGAVPVDGTTFAKGTRLAVDLTKCHAVVTHGSNACFDAALRGVPSIILGGAVLKPISSAMLKDIENPALGDRFEVFNALAYHQWTLKEFHRGTAFDTIRQWL